MLKEFALTFSELFVYTKYFRVLQSITQRKIWERCSLLKLNKGNKPIWGLPRWCSGKESTCKLGDARDAGQSQGWENSPGGGNGNPLQYSFLKDSLDRGA